MTEWNGERSESPSDLAFAIARGIFDCGSEPSRGDAGIVQRIEFIGGEYPDNETRLGGLCEEALARRVEQTLNGADRLLLERLVAAVQPGPTADDEQGQGHD